MLEQLLNASVQLEKMVHEQVKAIILSQHPSFQLLFAIAPRAAQTMVYSRLYDEVLAKLRGEVEKLSLALGLLEMKNEVQQNLAS